MRIDVFDQALARIVEFKDLVGDLFGARVVVSVCGLGEPLLHREAASCVAKIRDAGLACVMSSNGSLLDERRGEDLLRAGLQGIFVNVGQIDDAYEQVYGLPFEKTRDNVIRFARAAGERCPVVIVLVGADDSPDQTTTVQEFWREQGIARFLPFELVNRGGALLVEAPPLEDPHLADARAMLDELGVEPRCSLPFEYPFIAYDGQYHLCASDWRRMAPLGSVFERSLLSVTREKLLHVQSREPVCRTCSLDPTNRLAQRLRTMPERADANDGAALIDTLAANATRVDPVIARLVERSAEAPDVASGAKKRIPVHAAAPV